MKKDVPAFLHDSNAHRDEKLLELRAVGFEAGGWPVAWAWVGLYWALVEMMRDADGFRLRKRSLGGIAMSYSVPMADAMKFLSECYRIGLFDQNDECFWSRSLIDRMGRFEAKRKKCSASGAIGAQKRWGDSDTIANATGKGGDSIANATKKDGECMASSEIQIQIQTTNRNTNERGGAGEENPPDGFAPLTEEMMADPRFMNCGQRPLLKYPEIWLSVAELGRVLEIATESSLKDKRALFETVQGALRKPHSGHGKPNAFCWLTGWALREVLETKKSKLDAKRAELYLANATGGTV